MGPYSVFTIQRCRVQDQGGIHFERGPAMGPCPVFMVQRFKVQGLGFRVWGLGFRV